MVKGDKSAATSKAEGICKNAGMIALLNRGIRLVDRKDGRLQKSCDSVETAVEEMLAYARVLQPGVSVRSTWGLPDEPAARGSGASETRSGERTASQGAQSSQGT